MSNLAQLEKQALSLKPSEREHLALTVWRSLESKIAFDSAGIEIALERDNEMALGKVNPIGHSEFVKKTSGENE